MENKKFVISEDNVEKIVGNIALWIKEKVKMAGADGVVLGMSSGVDCSVVARLCQEAGVDTHLIIMPYGDNMDKSKSYEHAMELIKRFNFTYSVFDIKPVVDALTLNKTSNLANKNNSSQIELAYANIRPRVRMTYLYQYAQVNNLLVIGTGNLSEITVGYFTKWGDGAYDLNPLGYITKKEVYILARYLKVPECIINKSPSAELWEGQTDEAEIGISYNKIDQFILNGTTGNEKEDVMIKLKNSKSLHKINTAPKYNEVIK